MRLVVRSGGNYLVQIYDKLTDFEYTAKILHFERCLMTSNADIGDNVANCAVLLEDSLYFADSDNQLKHIKVDRDGRSATITDLGVQKVVDVATDGKHVYYVTLDGLISNLEQKSINVKLPCQEDEKFTHMKYGCGMLIAISYRQVGKVSASKFHLVGFSGSHKGLVHTDSSVTVEAQGESRLG